MVGPPAPSLQSVQLWAIWSGERQEGQEAAAQLVSPPALLVVGRVLSLFRAGVNQLSSPFPKGALQTFPIAPCIASVLGPMPEGLLLSAQDFSRMCHLQAVLSLRAQG